MGMIIGMKHAWVCVEKEENKISVLSERYMGRHRCLGKLNSIIQSEEL